MKDDREVIQELLRVARDLTADIGIKTLVVDDKDADIVEKDLIEMVERGEIIDFVRVSHELVRVAKDLVADKELSKQMGKIMKMQSDATRAIRKEQDKLINNKAARKYDPNTEPTIHQVVKAYEKWESYMANAMNQLHMQNNLYKKLGSDQD